MKPCKQCGENADLINVKNRIQMLIYLKSEHSAAVSETAYESILSNRISSLECESLFFGRVISSAQVSGISEQLSCPW